MLVAGELHLSLQEKRHGARTVLGAIDLHLRASERMALWGRSGCGKTTLLRILAGVDPAFTGNRRCTAQRLAMVFQTPSLLPWRSVADNIRLAAPGSDAEAALETVGLAGWGDAYPAQLSLGMQRRAAVARALAANPDVLLLDEPFASLDRESADLVHAALADSTAAMVLVVHDQGDARRLCRRLVALDGTPARIMAQENW